MAGNGIASIGECMLELSGRTGSDWRMGFAGDTFNTLWALHALGGDRPATYVSAFGDDPFSRDQIEFFAASGIGIGASPVRRNRPTSPSTPPFSWAPSIPGWQKKESNP